MGKLIDADKLLKDMQDNLLTEKTFTEILAMQPPVDAVPVTVIDETVAELEKKHAEAKKQGAYYNEYGLSKALEAFRQSIKKNRSQSTDDVLEMFHAFRKRMDGLCYPVLKEWSEETGGMKIIRCDGKIAGFLMIIDGYVEGIYIKPDFRRKGLARQAVLDAADSIRTFHIINTNEEAKAFWFSVLNLEPMEWNRVDTLYSVEGVKNVTV